MLKEFNFDEKMILLATLFLFLPYQIASIGIACILVQALCRHKLVDALKQQTGALFFYSFVGLEFVVTILHANWNGFGNVWLFVLIGLYGAYYRKSVTKNCFEKMCDLIVVLSVLAAIYGLYQFNQISIANGRAFLEFHIFNSPTRRITSTFMNANIYAMIIDFVCVICMYRFVKNENILYRIFYFIVALFNFFVLYLTGSRTALLPFVIIFPIFLYCIRWKKLFITSIVLELCVCGLVFLKPNLIPRISDMSTFASRIKIWKTAFLCISMHPFFGWGPQTYKQFYPLVHGHKAPHAHNIYIDSILSYGIMGTLILLAYIFLLNKEIFTSNTRKENPALFGMMMCFIAIVLIYGLLDCTLNIVATGTLCFIILNSACMYLEK